MWTREEAIALCVAAEQAASVHGLHVALGGGLLTKMGERKDCDLIIYSHGAAPSTTDEQLALIMRKRKLLDELRRMGLQFGNDFGRVVKTTYLGRGVDLIFCEISGLYPEADITV